MNPTSPIHRAQLCSAVIHHRAVGGLSSYLLNYHETKGAVYYLPPFLALIRSWSEEFAK